MLRLTALALGLAAGAAQFTDDPDFDTWVSTSG
jgi:hypothetical protein